MGEPVETDRRVTGPADPRPLVLVLASTFPAHADDPVPAFVKDQVEALAALPDGYRYAVLAPHDARSSTRDRTEHAAFTEYRFHYARPRRLEVLAGRGIMPTLRRNKAFYAVVPSLFGGEYRALRRLVRQLKPDLLYAHWFTPQAVVAAEVSRRTGVPFVFTTHASDVEVWRKVPGVGARIVRGAVRRASGMTAVSRRSAAKLTRFLGAEDAARVQILPMGTERPAVDPARRAEVRADRGWAEKTVLLFMGRLVEKKGVIHLIDALADARDRLGDWVAVIAGDGPLRVDLESAVTAAGLSDRVTFAGYVTSDAKTDLLAAADVFLVPSVVAADGDAEGLPVSLLEGLAWGIPSIATPESGADDVLTDGVDGVLVPGGDPAALAAALERLVGAPAAERARMSAAARELAESFAWPRIARRTHDDLFAPALRAAGRD